MQVKAKLKNLKISPKKVRLVAGLVRGKEVNKALNELRFLNKKSAKPVLELIKSAIANGEHNLKLDKNNLVISEIKVDQGITLKRYRPRAFGRAGLIRKKMSHIELVLSEIVPTKKGKTSKKDDKVKVKAKDEQLPMKSEKPKEAVENVGDINKVATAQKPKQHIEQKTINRTTNK